MASGALIEGSGSPGSDVIRAELEAVLTSDAFVRAPSLAQFLRYVCQKALSGEAGQIKEYNIAVEAFGRQPSFDQKEDAIVRVEAHRLRKRLKQYYEGEGLNHRILIVIPSGQYAPIFVSRSEVNSNAIRSPEEAGTSTSLAPVNFDVAISGPAASGKIAAPPLRRARRLAVPITVMGATLLVAAISVIMTGGPGHRTSTGFDPAGGSPAAAGLAAGDEGVRIACGLTAAKYVDSLGNTWLGDRYYQGGNAWSTPADTILRTRDAALFQTRREGTFRYDIPLAPGNYELHLLFAERVFGTGNLAGGGETSRIFHVFANGSPILESLDVISDAEGSNTADEKVFKDIAPGQDGFLHLQFTGFKETAFVNGIVILPATRGRMRPVRMVPGANPVRDALGRVWSADQYTEGGQLVTRTTAVTGTKVPEIYRDERFGNFNYAIPAAPGRYKLTLYFAESWFGPSRPGRGGEGSRVFDVHCNGSTLLRNFDVYKTAGGHSRAVEKTFRGLTPNAQGKLIVAFVPVRNYAIVNAIELEAED